MKVMQRGGFGGKRQRHLATIWSLPEELTLHLLKGLHVRDLLNMRSTHSHFRDLIDSNASIWSSASFEDVWPNLPNMVHFEKAAAHGNLQALVKLGIAYLYNEGLPGDFHGKKISRNGEQAAGMFCQVECLTPHVMPFTWLFIRPPWALSGACCKECVFNNMKQHVAETNDPSVHVCIAQTLQLLDEDGSDSDIIHHLDSAARQGNSRAAFLLWQHKYKNMKGDRGQELEGIRVLRDIATRSDPITKLELCRLYSRGQYGGIEQHQAAAFTRDFVQSSIAMDIRHAFSCVELTHSMRYILVDWLVEVAGMKDFCSLTLHVAINVVDRFLRAHPTTRSRLQLLGVSAMVLCSRFLGRDIITIREAAWLTDNTYRYEDVVRMMGEITATLKGNFRMLTSLDYTSLLGSVAGNDTVTQSLSEYICELALLHSSLSTLKQAVIAASCVLLARLVQKKEYPWPHIMQEFTGFSVQDITGATIQIHEKCFVDAALVDHREVVLQAVKQRYEEEVLSSASNIQMISEKELRTQLGVPQPVAMEIETEVVAKRPQELIMSPCRNSTSSHTDISCQLSAEREKAATPTMESMEQHCEGCNDSVMSGYDGDKEDEGESFFDIDDCDWDPDLESLWCGDSSTSQKGQLPQDNTPVSECSLLDSSFEGVMPLYTKQIWSLPYDMCLNMPHYGLSSTPKVSTSNILPPCAKSDGNNSLFSHSFVLRGDLAGYSMCLDGDQSKNITNHSGLSFSLDADQSFRFGSHSGFSMNLNAEESLCSPSTSAIGADSGIDVNHPSPLRQSLTIPTPRKALHTLNIEPQAATSKMGPTTAKSVKRKSSHELGNKTKTHVSSHQ